MSTVSILVPVYGVEHYIERCARSLFEQTYQNIEYVFVNDCSQDQSIKILNEVIKHYPDRQYAIKIINHEINRGLAASRNTGLDNSTGDYVVCVDSDDWLELNAIERLLHGQMVNDADIVSGGYLVHQNEGEPLWRKARDYKDKEQMVLQMMQRTWDHFVAGRLVRRSLFVNNGLRWVEGLDVAEDRFMMTMLAYFAKSFNSVADVIYHYERGNANALTKTVEGKRVFRNNNQELKNLMSLEQFFTNKESVYQKECSRCIIEQLAINLRAAISYSSREEYNRVVSVIEGRNDFDLQLAEWEKNGVKGCLKHCYTFSLLHYKIEKAIRFIRKHVKTGFSVKRGNKVL